MRIFLCTINFICDANGTPIKNRFYRINYTSIINKVYNNKVMLFNLVVSEFGTCLSSEPSYSVQDSVVSVQNPDTQSRTQSSQSRTETGPQLRYNIHSLDKSHRDFCRSISKTYERSIFSKTSTGHIYYVSHNDFCTDLKIICCIFEKNNDMISHFIIPKLHLDEVVVSMC